MQEVLDTHAPPSCTFRRMGSTDLAPLVTTPGGAPTPFDL